MSAIRRAHLTRVCKQARWKRVEEPLRGGFRREIDLDKIRQRDRGALPSWNLHPSRGRRQLRANRPKKTAHVRKMTSITVLANKTIGTANSTRQPVCPTGCRPLGGWDSFSVSQILWQLRQKNFCLPWRQASMVRSLWAVRVPHFAQRKDCSGGTFPFDTNFDTRTRASKAGRASQIRELIVAIFCSGRLHDKKSVL